VIQPSAALPSGALVEVRAFTWAQWPALWALRFAQLAEQGIRVADSPPAAPDLDSPYEVDYHRLDQVYLAGAGGFWLAWAEGAPVGHVGAQDLGGGAIELRRMYVRAEYRRQGIGSLLVRTLIAHCAARGAAAIELWTAPAGPGRWLYGQLGFRRAVAPGPEFAVIPPNENEIRMRLDLGAHSQETGERT